MNPITLPAGAGLIQEVEGQPLSPEQRTYLDGFFAGVQQRAVVFADLFPEHNAPQQESAEDELPQVAEERIKNEEHPLDSYYRLVENARHNQPPDKEETFRFKWNGLFYLTPVKDAFMARLRIPGGQLMSHQVRELARIAKELTTGYVQVTTRANLQLRLIEPKNTPEFLRRVQAIGLHTRGSGADNIRNLTSNPTAGIDPVEIIDCTRYVRELADFIIEHREFYNLPRKFNIAFDGGGLIGSVEDTNDIGVKAVQIGGEARFRIALGGATGHKAFARDLGVLVPPEDIVKVVVALVRVFIANGCRTDRKKARLKHLLDTWTLDQYLAETEKLLGAPLRRASLEPLSYPAEHLSHSHIGAYPQRQRGLNYLGIALPAGQITPRQLVRLAELSKLYGSGELRLTVWQNFILPNIPDAFLETVKKAVIRIGLDHRQSNIASGVIACTGNRYCKFSSTDTKGHALELTKYLEKRIALDRPINIHVTGCPHSCAQHYMGDIGLLGAKTRDGREAYHVCVGGGFGNRAAIGRQVFQAMPFEELKPVLERMLRVYLREREAGESFQAFTVRHDLNALQTLFSGDD
ncbi:MAG: NirA family protein [Terrimicrobiaceae bacterium]|nr:NirA family protein [Terrimicrobiaceae bacterium]